MPSYFLDTSALVKLYVAERGSERMIGIAASEDRPSVGVLAISPLEFRSAIRRREREGDIAADEVTQLLERFALHLASRFERVPVTDPVIENALVLVDRHALRAYDALQLAGCLQWRQREAASEAIFACSDRVLLTAASSEGLPTFDPTASGKVR